MRRASGGIGHFTPDEPPREREAPANDNVALLRSIWDPIERGESDIQPFFDALADDVVFETPVGELRGRQAVIDYLDGSDLLEFHPFEKAVEYYGDGDRVVQVGEETFRVKQSGLTHHAPWAWVSEIHEGRITRIVEIQHLGAVAEAVRDVVSRAQSGGA
jgi:ketosteroid isomerase-like protein